MLKNSSLLTLLDLVLSVRSDCEASDELLLRCFEERENTCTLLSGRCFISLRMEHWEAGGDKYGLIR